MEELSSQRSRGVWNWSTLCDHGENLQAWEGSDFGHCFEQLAILSPTHAFLALISSYHFGRRRSSLRGNSLYVSWTSFLIVRFVCTVALMLSPVCQIIFSISLEHMLPSIADGVFAGLAFLSWTLHALYVWNVRYLHSNSLRGPLSAVISVLLVAVSSAVHVHTVVTRRMAHSPHQLATEEYTAYLNAAFCLIYFFTLIPNKSRIYHSDIFCLNGSEEASEPLTWDRIRSYSSTVPQRENVIVAEARVGCISWLTFQWVQPLMSRGAVKKINSVDDLYKLPRRLNTNLINQKFEKIMIKAFKSEDQRKTRALDASGSFENSFGNSAVVSDQHQAVNDRGQSLNDPSQYQVRYEGMRTQDENITSSPYETGKHSLRQISLFKVLNSAFGLEYYCLGMLRLLGDCLSFAGPLLLNYLVTFIEDRSEPMFHGYLLVGGLFLSTLLGTVCYTQFDYNVQVVAYKIRCAVVTTIYRKSLTISGVAQSRFTSGEIVNFMSTDCDRILNFCPSFHAFWSLPFKVAVSLYLLYQQVGLAFLAGLTFAVLLVPVNRWLAKKIGKLSREMMQHKDGRVKLMSEILYGIRVVKLHSWESHFADRIASVRQQELKCLRGRKYLDALCVYFWGTTPVLISILTFGTYVLMGHTLTAAKVFTSLSLFVMLISPLNAFPWVLNGLVEAWVSLQRVQKFVCLTDMDPGAYYSPPAQSYSGAGPVIRISNASFSWQPSSSDTEEKAAANTVATTEGGNDEQDNLSDLSSDAASSMVQDLLNITVDVHRGQLVGVIGRVGAGKSSFLASVLGELRRLEGEIAIDDLDAGFAFVSQEPWLQQAAIRDNILFGRPFESQRYNKTLEACALTEDLKMMPSGDLTEVGENGVTLSGGQRARVALARAVYQDKSVYLLDDPLSAVDAHVAQHLYTHCIAGLLGSKTRVLCTHQLKFLARADWVIVLEDGNIAKSGVPSDVLPHVQMLESNRPGQRHKDKEDEEEKAAAKREEAKEENLVKEEGREKGVVKAAVYKSYWLAVGTCLSPSVLLALFFMQASRNLTDWWLAFWVTHSQDSSPLNSSVPAVIWPVRNIPAQNLSSGSDNLNFYLGIYGGLAACNSIFTLMRAFMFAYGGVKAATVIHQRLLKAILKAPMSFFDMTPVGRILNRFSSDLYAVDDGLPFILNIFLAQTYGILGTLVITCYGLPWFTISLVPMAVIYYKIQHYYRHTSRELKRLSSVSLSPIYSHFSETIIGLTTIRAMRHSTRFCQENIVRLDMNQRAQYATQLSARWLDFRLRMLGVAMVTCISFVAVIQHQLSSVNSGLVGLAISYALAVTNLLGGVVMFFTETEKEFVSVERCQQYIVETPVEKWNGTLFPPSVWPSEGVVEFEDVCLRYNNSQARVLNGVSFKTEPGEKVGIVGRTGAGKSSLFLSLFRLAELSQGRIIVDDIVISMLDLNDIRSKFAIIPQDPFLFSGTIRLNLDPTSVHSDSDLWAVLDRCHLSSCVDRMGGLEAKLTQRGREFSVGQRQLLCLARALLSRAKVLCIDEATASVDQETDSLIQSTIRHEFRNSTVLTIAHRVNTVLDSQRVLVMKDGQVAEFAPPDDLLKDSSSLFYQFVYGGS
ncbi:multidrug resistance-associated protein 7 isoform X2 [Aplysia californica]|uniref:Multidrug resistance-associated protein 7 isoform X2 n=1 Tax=Aplysia californica TaxID=6500 RepID=A0ABM0JY85_APLCA|nr:multidrug resistance-associated protein 7 isoform X2 [Aplysia californica]